MKKEIVIIDGVPKPASPFNHVIKAGGFLFLTSQLSCDLKNNRIIGGTMEEQTRRALDNVKFLLLASGSAMIDVVKVVIYMRDLSKFREMNAVYREYFVEGEEPARVTVQAPSPIEEIDIEIEVIAIAS
ncbi:MAG: RidA family protein [Candidatus Bathyarchaeota archaeon]|nr:RidA family protein [Candidatus Bathyarchaeota archaeon]